MRRLLALLPLLVAAPAAARAQYAQPWNGGGLTAEAVPARPERRIVARAVAAVALTVSDADRSARFYREVLAFEPVLDTVVTGDEWARLTGIRSRLRLVRLQLGDEQLELVQYLDRPGRAAPMPMASNDRWFQHVAVVVRDMDAAYARLERAGVVRVSPAPQRLPATIPAAEGIRAFYFRDPDGHPLEILEFPPDKGAAKWHAPTDRLFLGIDHTAIVVRDTKRSLGFWAGVLGLEKRGESMNFGAEQERLNDVVGARLRISGLRAQGGAGVEFLDYLAPSEGRPYPGDARPNDLLHWQTRVVVDDVAHAFAEARARGARAISAAPVPLDPAATGFRRAALVRDPDGHAVELVER